MKRAVAFVSFSCIAFSILTYYVHFSAFFLATQNNMENVYRLWWLNITFILPILAIALSTALVYKLIFGSK